MRRTTDKIGDICQGAALTSSKTTATPDQEYRRSNAVGADLPLLNQFDARRFPLDWQLGPPLALGDFLRQKAKVLATEDDGWHYSERARPRD